MKYDFTDIYKKQIELDNYIFKKHNLSSKETYEKRKIAFLIELGEFANEVRTFKFWSKKTMSKEEIVIEEFIDGLHFIVSVGVDMKNQDWKVVIEDNKNDFNDQLMETYVLFIKYSKSNNLDDYQKALKSFVTLGAILGFTYEKLIEAYLLKYKENIKRQENNY